MALHQIAGVVIGQPDLAPAVSPRQRFHGKVDSDRLPALHQRGACLRVTENQQLRRAQHLVDLCSASGVVDAGKHGHALVAGGALEAVQSLIDGVDTLHADQSVVGRHRGDRQYSAGQHH